MKTPERDRLSHVAYVITMKKVEGGNPTGADSVFYVYDDEVGLTRNYLIKSMIEDVDKKNRNNNKNMRTILGLYSEYQAENKESTRLWYGNVEAVLNIGVRQGVTDLLVDPESMSEILKYFVANIGTESIRDKALIDGWVDRLLGINFHR